MQRQLLILCLPSKLKFSTDGLKCLGLRLELGSVTTQDPPCARLQREMPMAYRSLDIPKGLPRHWNT